MLLRAEFGHRWRSWVYLALLVTLVSGLVLAGMAAGRRTASAFPRYLAAYGADAEVFSFKPIPAVASLPEVEESASVLIPANGPPACRGCRLLANQNFGVVGLAPQDVAGQVKLLSGRMPDQSNPAEVLASFTMQRDLGIRLGSHIRIRFASARQRNEILNGTEITPNGPLYDFRVVGIEAFTLSSPTSRGFDALISLAVYHGLGVDGSCEMPGQVALHTDGGPASPGTIGATLPADLPEFPYGVLPVAIAGLIFAGYVLHRRRRLQQGTSPST
jgi:hypothetical protein